MGKEKILKIKHILTARNIFSYYIYYSGSKIKKKNQLKFILKNLKSGKEKQDIQKVSRHIHKETETALAAFFQGTTDLDPLRSKSCIQVAWQIYFRPLAELRLGT